MMRRLYQLLGRECTHPHTLVVRSVGVTRTVCEHCGHLSFKIQSSVAHHFDIDEFEDERLPQAAGL